MKTHIIAKDAVPAASQLDSSRLIITSVAAGGLYSSGLLLTYFRRVLSHHPFQKLPKPLGTMP